MKVKTRIKAGGMPMQHNETLVKGTPRKRACACGDASAVLTRVSARRGV
jgi:hypothetical protein